MSDLSISSFLSTSQWHGHKWIFSGAMVAGPEKIDDRLIRRSHEWELGGAVRSRLGRRLVDLCGCNRRDRWSGCRFRLGIENSGGGICVWVNGGLSDSNSQGVVGIWPDGAETTSHPQPHLLRDDGQTGESLWSPIPPTSLPDAFNPRSARNMS